ncbi:hypothetical protein CFR73_11060 [Novacetimonas maltaceti]|nr:hypothetical protein CFR73_11060 [Novacetimonas maltaceti]
MLFLMAGECALTAFAMAALIVVVCMLARRRMPWGPAAVQAMLLLLLLPGVGGALCLPRLSGSAIGAGAWPVLQGMLLCPLVTVLPLRSLLRVPASISRTAWGLGAGTWMRARLLWLPLLGPSLVLSACAGLGMGVLAAMADVGPGVGT